MLLDSGVVNPDGTLTNPVRLGVAPCPPITVNVPDTIQLQFAARRRLRNDYGI